MLRTGYLLALCFCFILIQANSAKAQSAPGQQTGTGSDSVTTISGQEPLLIDAAHYDNGTVSFSGGVVNHSTIYLFSSDPRLSTATISAGSLINNGVISTVVPVPLLPATYTSPLNLAFSLTGGLVNTGTISSAANLAITAGGAVQNSGSLLAQQNLSITAQSIANISAITSSMIANSLPTIQSGGTLAIQSLSGNITNAGLMQSLTDSIRMTSAPAVEMLINNASGSILANMGSISIGNVLNAELANVTISGGKLLASEVSVFGKHSMINVQDISRVNITGSTASIVTSTDKLTVGNLNLSGDPVIANSAGDVLLTGDLIFPGQDLAILASGNVSTTGAVSQINLSSTTGDAGDLWVVAGFNFTPATNGQILDSSTTFTLTGPSATGGTIDLGAPIIRTTSTVGDGGNVNLMSYALGGPTSNPNLGFRQIYTNSTNGQSGDVNIYSASAIGSGWQGGAPAIDAGGARGGNIDIRAANPVLVGSVQFVNGTKTSGQIAAAPIDASTPYNEFFLWGYYRAVYISSHMITSSSTGTSSGSISVIAPATITLNHLITSAAAGSTTGVDAGNITVISQNRNVGLNGAWADGGNANNSTRAGNGGNILVTGKNSVGTEYSPTAKGGNNTGTGSGGNGGNMTFALSNDNPNGYYEGLLSLGIPVNGINLNGGTSTGGAGGNGGNFKADTGTFAINGLTANGGVGFSSLGAPGNVQITTYGTQPIPLLFDLTSTALINDALPGGMFTVGSAAVNGSNGAITAGAASATAANASRIVDSTPFNMGTISIRTFGSSASLNRNGTVSTITSDNGAGVRTKTTTAEAMAIFQTSRDSSVGAQTLGINMLGQATDINPQTGNSRSIINIKDYNIPFNHSNFSVFDAVNLDTDTGAGQITLNVSGQLPFITCINCNTFRINGQLNFTTPEAHVFFRQDRLNAARNAFLTSGPNSVMDIGPNGSIATTSDSYLLMANWQPLSLDFSSAGAINAGIVNFSGGINLNQSGGSLNAASFMGGLNNATLTNMSSQSNLALDVNGTLTLAANSKISADQNVTLRAVNGGNLIINSGVTISAGQLTATAPPAGVIVNSNIASSGTVRLTAANSLVINSTQASPVAITSSGGDVSLISQAGNTTLSGNLPGDGGLNITANGGNITIWSAGNITAKSTGNSFIARALAQGNQMTGGGIEIAAGVTNSTALPDYFNSNNTSWIGTTTPLGNNVIVSNNNNSGMLSATVTGGGYINVGSLNPNNPTIIDVSSGAVILQALNGFYIDMDPFFGAYSVGVSLLPPAPPVVPLPIAPLPPIVIPVVAAPAPAPTPGTTILSTDAINQPVRVATTEQTTETRAETRLAAPQTIDGRFVQYIADGACQPFVIDNDESAIIGQLGSSLSYQDKHSVKLNQGRFIAMSGKRLSLDTEGADIQVGGRSVVIVEQTANGSTRVAQIEGPACTVRLKGSTREEILRPGEELILAAGDEELIPIDGVNREPINAGMRLAKYRVKKNRFKPTEMLERDQLLACSRGSFLGKINRIIRRPKDLSYVSPTPLDFKHFKQIAYTSTVASQLHELSTSACTAYFTGKANQAQNRFTLEEGKALITARHATEVQVRDSVVKLKPGSIALIEAAPHSVSVRNLHDTHAKGVSHTTAGRTVSLAPGQQCLLASSQEHAYKIMESDSIGKRRVATTAAAGSTLVTCEFSPVNLLQNHIVMSLIRSTPGANQSKLLKSVQKTAAAISIVTSRHGPYANGGRFEKQ